MERMIYTIALILLLPSCSWNIAATIDRNWQRWNYPEACDLNEALPGAFFGGLEYGAIIGGYRDTVPVYRRYLLRGWFVELDHGGVVTATELRKAN